MNSKNTTVLVLCILFTGFLLFYQQKSFAYISEQKSRCNRDGKNMLTNIKQVTGVQRTDDYFYSKKLDTCVVYTSQNREHGGISSVYVGLYDLWGTKLDKWFSSEQVGSLDKSSGAVKSFEEIVNLRKDIQ